MLDNLSDEVKQQRESSLKGHEEIKNLIKEEVIKRLDYTNGKVGELVRWREFLNGASWVGGGVFVVIILPLIIWALIEVKNIDSKIQTALENNFTVEPYVDNN